MAGMATIENEDDFSQLNSGLGPEYRDSQSLLQSATNVLMLDKEVTMSEELNIVSPVDRDDGFILRDDLKDDSSEDVELSPDGILDEETISRGLSNLGRSADGTHQVYLHVTVPVWTPSLMHEIMTFVCDLKGQSKGLNLHDISLLAAYEHLQKVEVPYNEITDLSPLGSLPYLLILNASHNQISNLLNFTSPKNLKEVDLSFNLIEEMADLSRHHYLQKIILDHNKIHDISGLENCHRLRWLSLAHNHLGRVHGLGNLPIQYLDVCHNEIRKIENLDSLSHLRQLFLSGNKIRSMQGLQGHNLLETVDLEDNEVIDMQEITYIQGLEMLREFNLLRNPIQELPDYRLSILFRLQMLTELDREKVEVSEKVEAVNMFNPPTEVVAARDHILHVIYNFLQPAKIWDSTLPSVETPYPMLVLVGPQGCGKKDLSHKLREEFCDYFGTGISHTTRSPYPTEIPGRDYHFITLEKFENDIKMGHFVQSYQYGGNWYGLQMESIESIAREGLACIINMELEGVLTLKNTYFEPRYVLILPMSKEAHERRLLDMGLYSEKQIEYTLDRAEMYSAYNETHPGFFDTMIDTTNIQEAYQKLRHLVMDYLGVYLPTPSPSEGSNSVVESPNMERRPGSNAMGARTWSKPSLSDSQSLHHGRASTQTPALSSRGIVEEESIIRRQSAAKEAVSGYVPPLYDQIVRECPRTAPNTSSGGFNDDTVNRTVSAPINMDDLPPDSSDATSSSSSCSPSFSSLSSASDFRRSMSPNQLPGSEATLPTERVDPLSLMSGGLIMNKTPPSNVHEVRPPSNGPRPDTTEGIGRPGSDRHKILPPIVPSPQPAY